MATDKRHTTADESADELTTGDEQLAEALERFKWDGVLLAWGHRPQLPKPRQTGTATAARGIDAGERIRVRYFDYGEQREILAFATVEAVVDALASFGGACELGEAGRVRHMLIRCPDDSIRHVSPSYPREVEIEEAS